MEWAFLVIAINTSNNAAIVVMPEKYEMTQCVELAAKYAWPWTANCIPAPRLSIIKEEKL